MTRISESDLRQMKGVPSEALALILDGIDAAANPGPWTVVMPDYSPPSLNKLVGKHWAAAARTKKAAMNRIAAALRDAGVPTATGKRRVTVALTFPNMSRALDPDNGIKVILDACRRQGAIVDDRAGLCECPMPTVSKGPRSTTITIEDL